MSSIREDFKASYDPYDSWGSVLAAWFDVAAELTYRGAGTPPRWQYRPSPTDDPREHDSFLFEACTEASTTELLDFGNTLERFARTLKHQGKDY